jgi:hypothetical protein
MQEVSRAGKMHGWAFRREVKAHWAGRREHGL